MAIVVGFAAVGVFIIGREEETSVTSESSESLESLPQKTILQGANINDPGQPLDPPGQGEIPRSPVTEGANPSARTTSPPVDRLWNPYRQPDLMQKWRSTAKLNGLLEQIKRLAIAQGLTTENLSIVVVDLNQLAIAQFNGDQKHYPASVAKLFWLVAFYSQVEQGLLSFEEYREDVDLMIRESDNNATSRIINALTGTTSNAIADKTIPRDFSSWRSRRECLNQFFSAGGYDINITQKTYPITDVEIMEPVGFDLKMRENPRSSDQPIRNFLSAYDAARLMVDLAYKQSVSLKSSEAMRQLLRRDLLNQDWQTPKSYFNPVQYFFGEGLPKNTVLYSKAGWTTQGRHEVAYVDAGESSYVLSVFGDDPAYGENQTFFPAIARLVHGAMVTP